MGSRLESVNERVGEAKEVHTEAGELGERDAEDIANVKSILDGMPADVDDDIVDSIQEVHDSSISEASADMESTVRQTLDSGSDIASDASDEALEQQGLSEQAASQFEQISGSSEFGSSAEGAADQAHQSADSFGEASEESHLPLCVVNRVHHNLLADIIKICF